MGYKLTGMYIGQQKIRPSGGGGWQPGANTLLYLPLKTDLLDHSGNNISITNNNTVLENGFAKFNGVSSYLQTTNDFSLSSTPFTVSFWMNANSIPVSGILGHNLYIKGFTGWNFYIVNNAVRSELAPNGGQIFTGTITSLVWYNIVMSVPSSGDRVMYMNGVQQSTGSNSADFENTPLYIGTPSWTPSNVTGTGMKYDGYMSDIIIEDKARTTQEVEDYYNLTKGNYGL